MSHQSTVPLNTLQQLQKLLHHARQNSPYYQKIYRDVSPDSINLQDYPVLCLEDFWNANTIQNNQVLTSKNANGITFKSGGSTGKPKYSVYSNEDWNAFTYAFGQGMKRAGLQDGEQIGNLFYAGRLYASFLFISKSIEQAGVGMCYPIGGIEPEEIIEVWKQFNLTTLVGVPTTLINMLSKLSEEDIQQLSLKHFLYGGEPMFNDQVTILKKYFPECQVRSIGIAGVDYGELGWVSGHDEIGVHHCFDDSTILEILDDENNSIDEVGQIGRIVITNLKRYLMPIIRYPVGDNGMWIDPPHTPSRRFKVLGRSDSGARIGPMTLYVDDIVNIISNFNTTAKDMQINNFQIVVHHFEQKDRCTLRLATSDQLKDNTALTQQIIQKVYDARPMFKDLLEEQFVHPLNIEWVNPSDLKINTRTGKLLRIIDLRHENS